MTNRPKQIGTAAETAVVRAARTRGFPNADRLTLTGALDRGDIGLAPGVIIEVKGGAAAKDASDGLIESWLGETNREAFNAGADVAFLVTQRRGVGATNAHRWWAWWRLGWLEQLRAVEPRCRVCGCTNFHACSTGCAWRPDDGDGPCCTSCSPTDDLHRTTVRMQLGDALQVVRAAGYGDPLSSDKTINMLRYRLTTTGTRRDVPGLSRACSVATEDVDLTVAPSEDPGYGPTGPGMG